MSIHPNIQAYIDDWLKGWGFTANPFRFWEAHRETNIDEYYVKHKFYEQLLASTNPTMVFAYRGEGKSATRIMLQKECQPQSRTSGSFAIPFSDFDFFIETYKKTEKISFSDYLPFLIHETIVSLLSACAFLMRENIQFTDKDISQIRFWIEFYAPRILEYQRVDTLMKEIWKRSSNTQVDTSKIDFWRKQILDNKSKSNNSLETGNPFWDKFFSLWDSLQKADLKDFGGWQTKIVKSSSKEVIQTFVRFVLDLLSKGKHPCYTIMFLIDGIDEYDETKNNPESSSKILSPLLWEMWFHRIDGLVNKFFLPMEQKSSFINSETRWDLFEIFDLSWSYSDKLIEIDLMKSLLRERIRFFNSEKKTTIAHMCEPELSRIIEEEMIAESNKSPRNLIRLGNMLFNEHCERDSERNSLITFNEWEKALLKYRATSHMARREEKIKESKQPNIKKQLALPNLRIKQAARKVFRGDDEIILSASEFDLLLELNRKIGEICSEEELIEALYRQSYSKNLADSIRSNIRHLRNKIEPKGQKKYLYIKNVRGRGYMLENVEN